ncbi:MAG: SAM-dependent methyltransferase [Proteobacteria bacterium]|nr:SAM-dependent methyltransferase [Pseudomonadota bacterium]
MDNENSLLSIADPSRPNAGRIYDYLLGGHHNFEVDRQAAEHLLAIAPFMPKQLIMIRWFLGEAVRRLIEEGYDKFVDFASGLPTMDHIHEMAPSGTRILYSDIDPVTVEYAQEIIGSNPNIRFVECDAGKPETLLESKVLEILFGSDRKVAIGFNGICYFLSDDVLAHSFKALYQWAAPGSKLFLCDADADPEQTTDNLKLVFDLYAKIGQPIYNRTKERLMEMAAPWQLDDPGLLSLDEWIGMGQSARVEAVEAWGGSEKGFYGVILKK